MSPFVSKVHQLENKYRHGNKVSFTFVPEGEYKKFAKYRNEYFKQQEKFSRLHHNQYVHSQAYSQAIDDLFSRINVKSYTVEEIVEMFDTDPVLSDHGNYIHEFHSVYDLLNKRGLKAKSSRKQKVKK